MYRETSKNFMGSALVADVMAPSTVPRWSATYTSPKGMLTGAPPRARTRSADSAPYTRSFRPFQSASVRSGLVVLSEVGRHDGNLGPPLLAQRLGGAAGSPGPAPGGPRHDGRDEL